MFIQEKALECVKKMIKWCRNASDDINMRNSDWRATSRGALLCLGCSGGKKGGAEVRPKKTWIHILKKRKEHALE